MRKKQNKIYVFRKDTKSWEEYYVKYMYTPFGGESVNWYFKNNGKEFYYIILSGRKKAEYKIESRPSLQLHKNVST